MVHKKLALVDILNSVTKLGKFELPNFFIEDIILFSSLKSMFEILNGAILLGFDIRQQISGSRRSECSPMRS